MLWVRILTGHFQVLYELICILEPLSKTSPDFSLSLQGSGNYPRILFKRYCLLFRLLSDLCLHPCMHRFDTLSIFRRWRSCHSDHVASILKIFSLSSETLISLSRKCLAVHMFVLACMDISLVV